MCICIGQDLEDLLRGQTYQAPVRKLFLAVDIVYDFGVCRWNGSLGGAVFIRLVRMWRKRNTPPLLVGLQACTTTLEINLAVPQKIGHSITSTGS